MAGQETLSSHQESPPEKRFGLPARLRQLSDRTPLRTKLITAVLGLVALALAAISVASVAMLRSYVTTRQDNALRGYFNPYFNTPVDAQGNPNLPSLRLPGNQVSYIQPGFAYPTNSSVIVALQVPGNQVSWYTTGIPGGGGGSSGSNLGQASLPQLPASSNWANAPNGALLTVPAQSGPDSWRVIAETQSYPVNNSGSDEKFTLVAAIDLGNINAMTARLVTFDLVVGGAIVFVLALVAIGVVRTNLQPLNDIELTAGQIAAGHLDHRVPEGDPRTEIGSLSRSLNAMLSQVERAFHAQGEAEQAAHRSEERMRRFIADAAHELRTPLTTIRGFAAHYRLRGGASRLRPGSPVPENASAASAAEGTAVINSTDVINGTDGAGQNPVFRTNPAFSLPASSASGGLGPEGLSPEELDHLMSRVESEATRMGMLVEDLLTLARLDQQRPITKAPVDLLTLAADAVQDARIVAPGRPIDLIVAPGTAFLIDGDEPRLRQVLANLVNNAITHTPTGTPVRVKIARGTVETNRGARATGTSEAKADWQTVPAVVLDVEDDGPGMTADQAQRVFERFYRADAARNRASGGTGLGLAIVAGLVSAHGGTVSVRTAPGKGADFQVKLPLSPDAIPLDDPDSAEDLPD